MDKFFKYFILLFLVGILGCSTKKNTGLTRFYHGLTTKYNILFNGTESYKEGLKAYKESYEDDYSQVLPIFIYGDEELAPGTKPQMDRTIEKSTKSIKLHSIKVKPDVKKSNMSEKDKEFYNKNEYNIFIDDSYLIMGKAFFFQADYVSAMRIFNFIINQYDDVKTKYLAYNWLIRSNVQIKDYKEAQEIIELLQTDIDYPEKLTHELNLSIADFYLKQQKYTEAEKYVSDALTTVKKKEQKIRLTFILAQINEKTNRLQEASKIYGDVIKLNPSYKVSFNAKIKRASLYTGSQSDKTIKKELLDMLKDDKNKEYQDQIYYALGELEMKNKNTEKAVEYYKLSAKTSVSNTSQKAITYLALANIYFEQTEYVEAQAYFDSAVVSLDSDFPGYTQLSMKNKYLSKLVKNLKEVKHQDSIQMVAKLPEKQRDQFIQNIIRDVKVKEAEEKARERGGIDNRGSFNRGTRPMGGESGKWYFYNPTAKSFGEPEFKRRWGTRQLEDNWRRRNKKVQGVESMEENELSDDIFNKKKGLDNKSPEYYMVELPLTDSAMQMSHEKIQKSLYNVGETYKNDLKDYPLAIDTYKELIDRYPESDYKVPAYYSIYKAYTQKGDETQANVYKNMIIRNYPNSKYAKVLTDPNYFKQFEKEELEKRNHYKQTFDTYKQGRYSEVLSRCNYGINKYQDSDEYIPKYRYLKALASGKIYGTTILKPELEKIINEFRGEPVAESSAELLASIQLNELNGFKEITTKEKAKDKKEKKPEEINQKTIQEIERLYSYSPKSVHYVAIITEKKADINQLKFNVINYNLDYYIQENFNIETEDLNDFFTILVIKQFKNSEEGKKYLDKLIIEEQRIFKDVKTDNYQKFIISERNFKTLIKEKVVKDYLIFFSKNYQD